MVFIQYILQKTTNCLQENKLKRVWLFQLGTIFKILISHHLYHTDHSAAVTGDWISLINLRSQVVLH